MKKLLLIISAAVVFSAGNAFGETHYVLPGDKIQLVIDNAEDGDTVVVIGGEYPFDVTIDSRDIKFKKPFGDNVTINGDVNLRNLNEHFEFIDFNVRGDTSNNEAVIVYNCKDIVLSKLQSRDVTIDGSSVLLLDSEIDDLKLLNNCTTKVIGCNLHTIFSDDSSDVGHVIFQNSIDGIQANSRGDQKLTIAYNKLRYLRFSHSGTTIMLGNIIDGLFNGEGKVPFVDSPLDYLVNYNMGNYDCHIEMRNNILRNVTSLSSRPRSRGVIFQNIQKSKIYIFNNIIHDIDTYYSSDWHDGSGIAFHEVPEIAEISGNAFFNIRSDHHGQQSGIYAPFDNVKIDGNYYDSTMARFTEGGCRPINSITSDNADTVFKDIESEDYHLRSNSICIDAGADAPWHFDRDGSRNDIGIYGASMFDPDGMTTENPVILFSNHEPLQLIKGKDKTINISAGGIVVP